MDLDAFACETIGRDLEASGAARNLYGLLGLRSVSGYA